MSWPVSLPAEESRRSPPFGPRRTRRSNCRCFVPALRVRRGTHCDAQCAAPVSSGAGCSIPRRDSVGGKLPGTLTPCGCTSSSFSH
jgi:hypothetical protein